MKRLFSICLSCILFFVLLTPYHLTYAAYNGFDDSIKVDQVVIYKADRKMLLISDGKILKKYRIALGKQPKGHKLKEGDHRTPEGTYYVQARNPNSKYYLSMQISYPSVEDKARAKKLGVSPGGNIMIHGMNDEYKNFWGRVRDWTQGCVAVHNHEMEEIWDMVAVGTPIKIFP